MLLWMLLGNVSARMRLAPWFVPWCRQKEGRPPARAFFGACPCIGPFMHCRDCNVPGQLGAVKISSSALTATAKPAIVSEPKLASVIVSSSCVVKTWNGCVEIESSQT